MAVTHHEEETFYKSHSETNQCCYRFYRNSCFIQPTIQNETNSYSTLKTVATEPKVCPSQSTLKQKRSVATRPKICPFYSMLKPKPISVSTKSLSVLKYAETETISIVQLNIQQKITQVNIQQKKLKYSSGYVTVSTPLLTSLPLLIVARLLIGQ